MSNVPKTTPQQARSETNRMLVRHGITDEFGLLGIRGYYLRTLGDPERNDRGIYDDAIILVTPTVYATFNANSDPSVYRNAIATLAPGTYRYRIGTHGLSKPIAKQYEALVQADDVVIYRDAKKKPETGRFGINIHRGARSSTSSSGCQTIYPSQWQAFITLVKSEMTRHSRRKIPYVLVEVAKPTQ